MKGKTHDISQILKSVIKRTLKLLKGETCPFVEELTT